MQKDSLAIKGKVSALEEWISDTINIESHEHVDAWIGDF